LVPSEQKALREFEEGINILSKLKSEDFAAWSKVYNSIGELYSTAHSLFLAEDCFLNALMRIKDCSGKK
jgi:hypothetical protein